MTPKTLTISTIFADENFHPLKGVFRAAKTPDNPFGRAPGKERKIMIVKCFDAEDELEPQGVRIFGDVIAIAQVTQTEFRVQRVNSFVNLVLTDRIELLTDNGKFILTWIGASQ